MPAWLLPESISDVLPTEARTIETLRRRLLDLYRGYGYELVSPPLLEHLDALLTGTGQDLELRTFKLVDQLSGRTLGVRADITPQVARIDAHLLNRQGVVRLCYVGSVLHTRPAGLLTTREPVQMGAEIYGHAGPAADLEILELVLASLNVAGLEKIRLDLNHVGIVRGLFAADPHAAARQEEILSLLRIKALPELARIAQTFSPASAQAWMSVANCYGAYEGALPTSADPTMLARVSASLKIFPSVFAAWQSLLTLLQAPRLRHYPGCELTFDLADMRGFDYHSGVTFAAYCNGAPNAVARGGRYDDVGQVFGRARPATGFSLELRELAGLMPEVETPAAICAPWHDDEALRQLVSRLRAQGEIVIQALPGEVRAPDEIMCDRQLVQCKGEWCVEKL